MSSLAINRTGLSSAGKANIYFSGKSLKSAPKNALPKEGGKQDEAPQNPGKGGWVRTLVIAAIIVAVVVALSILMQVIFPAPTGEPKTFTRDALQITLTDKFTETPADGYTTIYQCEDSAVFVLKESFADVEGGEETTLEQYGQMLIDKNAKVSDAELQSVEGLTCFEYQYKNDNNSNMYYFVTVYKTQDAFWLIQFATPKADTASYRETFIEWAKSVQFTNS